MKILNLKIQDFRNLKSQELLFSPGTNFIIGNNAQGKTSLLEAIFYLARLKSFRTNKPTELKNWDTDQFVVEAKIADRISDNHFSISQSGKNREITLNQKKITSLVDYLGKIKLVCFAPENIEIVKGDPERRRQYLDRHLVDLDKQYLKLIVNYNRALKSKKLLLKDNQANPVNLAPWNKLLADYADKITKKRLKFIEELEKQLIKVYQEFASEDGEISLQLASKIKDQGYQTVAEINQHLNKIAPEEIKRRKAIFGPHLDDLQILINGQLARSFASQGQARSLTLALMFAVVDLIEADSDDSPLILLDDLDSELDPGRGERLFDFIFSKPRQVFISGTEIRKDVIDKSGDTSLFNVEGGIVSNR